MLGPPLHPHGPFGQDCSPKRVYFVRHCQSESNILFDDGKKTEARALRDPHLSQQGREDAAQIVDDPLLTDLLLLSRSDGPEADTLLVVSPLRRALQTVEGAFRGWLRERASAGAPVRVELRPDIKECGSGDYDCDRGRPASELLAEFGKVLPGLRVDDLREHWYEQGRSTRSSSSEVATRLAQFTHWVQLQPESNVVVVGHQNIFQKMLEVDFHNGEVRIYCIGAASGPGSIVAAVPRRLPLTPPWCAVWPPAEPRRSGLVCSTPRCHFLVHSNPKCQWFCCFGCAEVGSHGPQCERRPAQAGAKKLSVSGEVIRTEDEMREALGALRLHRTAMKLGYLAREAQIHAQRGLR